MNKDNLIEFVLSNIHHEIIKTIDNKISYETPKAIKCATILALNIDENTKILFMLIIFTIILLILIKVILEH